MNSFETYATSTDDALNILLTKQCDHGTYITKPEWLPILRLKMDHITRVWHENCQANLTQYTGGVAAQHAADPAADFDELSSSILDMQSDAIPRSIPQPCPPPTRQSVTFASSPGDFTSAPDFDFDLPGNFATGQQNFQIDHRQSLDFRSGNSRSSPEPWTSLEATGVNPDHKTKDKAAAVIRTPNRNIETFSDASGQTSFLDSAIGLAGPSQHDTASQTSISITDMAQYPYPGMLPSQPEEVVPLNQLEDEDINPEAHTIEGPPARKGQPKVHNPIELTCEFEGCGHLSKTPSDAKKHRARHVTPYRCQVSGCNREEKGFATVNDLHRHEKSVHASNPRGSKNYKCFAPTCSTKTKIWPRLDNFKQHLGRMHPEIEIEDLIKQSDAWYVENHEDNGEQEAGAAVVREQALRNNQTRAVQYQASRPQRTAVPRLRTAGHQPNLQDPTRLSPNTARIPRSTPTPRQATNQVHRSQQRWQPYDQSGRPSQSQETRSEYLPQQQRRATLQSQRSTRDPEGPSLTSQPNVTEQFDFTSQPDFYQGHFDSNQYDVWAVQTMPDPGTSFWMMQQDLIQDTRPLKPKEDNYDLPDTAEVVAGMDTAIDTTSVALDSSPGMSIDPQTPLSAGPVRILINDEDDTESKTQKIVSDASAEEIKAFMLDFLTNKKADQYMPSPSYFSHRIEKFLSSRGSRSVVSTGDLPSKKDDESIASLPIFGDKHVQCPHCKKSGARPSEMKKHVKRHTKPYGCIIDGCFKRFGSKNDWKRHEGIHPHQKECYRCDGLHRCQGTYCFKVFYRGEDSYREHLDECGVTDIDATVQARKVPGNHQRRFWCGFCNDIIESGLTGHDAANFRLGHIDEHFQKEDGEICNGAWIELGAENKTKEQISQAQHEQKLQQMGCPVPQPTVMQMAKASQSTATSRPSTASTFESSLPSARMSLKRPRVSEEQMQQAQAQGQMLQRRLSSASQSYLQHEQMQRQRSTSSVQQPSMRRSVSNSSQPQQMCRSVSNSSQKMVQMQQQQARRQMMMMQQQQQRARQQPQQVSQQQTTGQSLQQHPQAGRQQQQQQQQEQRHHRDRSPARTYNDQGEEHARFTKCCSCGGQYNVRLVNRCMTCNHASCGNCKSLRHTEFDMGEFMTG